MTSCGIFPSGDFRSGSGTKATTHSPRTDPWGTPEATGTSSDEALSRTTLCAVRSQRKLFIQRFTSPVIPYLIPAKFMDQMYVADFVKSLSKVQYADISLKTSYFSSPVKHIKAWFLQNLSNLVSNCLRESKSRLPYDPVKCPTRYNYSCSKIKFSNVIVKAVILQFIFIASSTRYITIILVKHFYV